MLSVLLCIDKWYVFIHLHISIAILGKTTRPFFVNHASGYNPLIFNFGRLLCICVLITLNNCGMYSATQNTSTIHDCLTKEFWLHGRLVANCYRMIRQTTTNRQARGKVFRSEMQQRCAWRLCFDQGQRRAWWRPWCWWLSWELMCNKLCWLLCVTMVEP